MRKETFYISLLFGIIVTASGISLLTIYAVDHNYGDKRLVQYAEFWAVTRNGGGLGTGNESDLYVKVVPLSAETGDLRVFNLSFNVDASVKASYWVPVEFITALSAPSFPIFDSEWLRTADSSDKSNLELYQQGLATPHNITIYYEEVILRINASDTVRDLSLGRIPYEWTSEQNESIGAGFAYLWDSWLTYFPDKEGFVFYIADANQTVLDVDFNSDDSWSFTMLGFWNISFQQKYGSSLGYAGNGTLAHWLFKRYSNDTFGVSITIDNSYYRPPVAAFTVVRLTPWLEIGVLSIGLLITIVSTTVIVTHRKKWG